jgi:hypothetical protein
MRLIAWDLRSPILIATLCAIAQSGTARGLLAQGVATAAIHGTARSEDGSSVEGSRVRVVNTSTGFLVDTEVRHGRFLVPGLEVGGPYVVILRGIGFVPLQSEPLFLALGEPLEMRFLMRAAAFRLDTLRAVASSVPAFSQARADGGIATTISDSLLHRLPTLDRNFQDFARLAPQISTKVGLPAGGLSGGGVGFRFNDFLIDGAPERFLTGNSSLAFGGGKSVPLDAVREYQVLLAPFDVRYGDFSGALVNSVTRSGTNDLHGSAFLYARNDRLARRDEVVGSTPYDRWQYGFSLGGPIRRDRLHFFVATELQRLTAPAPGPYVGQPPAATPAAPVSAANLARLDDIMRGYGLVAGSGGPVQNGTPLANAFARLDLALPAWNSRAVASVNYARTTAITFSRSAVDTFPLSTYQLTLPFVSRLISLQLHTMLGRAGGGYNELRVSQRADGADWRSEVQQPIVQVAVPSTAGGLVTVVSGTNPPAQGMFNRSWTVGLADHLTLPVGADHEVTLGVEVERFRIDRGGVNSSYGTWTFSSLDSLALGTAERFETRSDFGSAGVPLAGGQYGAYVGDHWRTGERLSLSIGVRADVLAISEQAPYNPVIDSIFQRRTDEMPRPRLHLSPRLGFTWDVFGTGRDRLRGGLGVFTGRPPLNWAHSALYSYGVGIGVLRCGLLPTDLGKPPPFVPDYRTVPTACANGSGLSAAPRGDVDLLDRHLRMAQTLRGSLGYERQLPWNLLAIGEVLITRNISDVVFVNLNLKGVQAVDRHGRVLYGTIGPSGLAAAALRSGFSEVIDVTNTSKNHSVQVSARLERRFSRGIAATASYTYSQVWDVQTPLRTGTPGTVNWASRAVSGRHDDLTPGISLYEVPHRVVVSGTFAAPWRRWSTVVSFFYVGESGSPFTYLAGGVGRRGDLNADGSNANDPIYVPTTAADTMEIRFAGTPAQIASQQVAFDAFTDRTPCLRRQRGRIMERNSCREPWSNTTIVSVRQEIPLPRGALEAELDVFNLLNLLKSDWGRYRVAAPALLEQVGQTAGPPEAAQPVFRFDVARPQWTTLPTESAFQLQLALRYRF